MADNNYWLAKIRAQVCPEHSEAADFWNGLSPEWRGVVIHAAALEGREELKASLSNCLWRELFERLPPQAIMQIRAGIQKARNVFGGFGSLRESDFQRKGTRRNMKEHHPVRKQVEMVAAPHIIRILERQESLQGQAEER
ncbi:hypothetical protein D9B83_14015 [Serratia marcescens]|uniref:hypothetical protein n=1 Tax=Serratia marcescens TaxID=615 RepID=UPI000F7F2FFF|nr:hypothetical protein [Serratia marcescens]RTF37320.1 hypothetical protein D9B83_14015 [Serratia marcescens]